MPRRASSDSPWLSSRLEQQRSNSGIEPPDAQASDDAFSNALPAANNGTNRFATVFLYLNNAGTGGETVFPLSTTHATYKGGAG